MKRYEMSMPAELESLRIAAPFSDAVFKELPDLTDRSSLIHDLSLVTSEALTNALRHSETTEKPVSLAIDVDTTSINIIVTDHGVGFDPESVNLPEFDEFPEGGYGVYIMKTIMDSVQYEKYDNGNRLILTKNLVDR